MKYIRLDIYKKELRRLKKQLSASGDHRLGAQITALIGSVPRERVHSSFDGQPLIAYALSEVEKPDTGSVLRALAPYADILDNADFMSLMWQIKGGFGQEKSGYDIFGGGYRHGVYKRET